MKHPAVVIEIRPRLLSCQLYYHIERATNGQVVSLSVQTSAFTIKCNLWEETFVFDDFKLKSSLFNGLVADEENIISCRLQILILIDESQKQRSTKYVPKVEKDKPVQVTCRFCYSNLLKVKTPFNRILPLPSSDFSAGDFFCHGCSGNDFESKYKADPKPHDLFYGNYFFKISCDLLCNSMIFIVEDILHCQQCKTLLGSNDGGSIKMWNCTVSFDLCNDSRVTPKGDFVSVVKSVVDDYLGAMCKIIIKCKTSSSSDKEYLLLWVMDRNLPLLVRSDDSNKLVKRNVIKLLYTHEKSDSQLVSQWKKDINSHTVDVPQIMFTEGLDYLEQSNCLFPVMFRQAHEMNVGYLGI